MDTEPTTLDVTFRVQAKHADLWAAAKKLGGVSKLADYLGVGLNAVHGWVKLKTVPSVFSASGNATRHWPPEKRLEFEKRLFDLTGKTLEELWPDAVFTSDFLDLPKEVEATQRVDIRRLAHQSEATLALPMSTIEIEEVNAPEVVKDAMRFLDKRSREIITRRFGLDGEPQTLQQVGEALKISRERVRAIEVKAIRKMEKEVKSLPQFKDPEDWPA